MKTKLTAFAASLVLFLSGCSTTGTTISPETGASFLRTGTSVAAYEGLKNNPKYVAAAGTLVSAIDVALTGNAMITDATITAFCARVAAQNKLDGAETLFLTNIARTAFTAYAARFNVTSVLISDPQAKLYVQAFRDGLSDAVAMQAKPVATPQ